MGGSKLHFVTLIMVVLFVLSRIDLKYLLRITSLFRITSTQKLSVFVGFRKHWDTKQIGTICYCDRGISVKLSTDFQDPRIIDLADFVVFVLDPKMKLSQEIWKSLHDDKPPHQLWIYACRESPTTAKRLAPPQFLKYAFEWSFTYHSTATFSTPYGRYHSTNQMSPLGEVINYAETKEGLLCWMSSHCNTLVWNRKQFVIQLTKYINVDMYGACGNLTCPRDNATAKEKCNALMYKYKFSLALENSCCSEYITEKFWNALRFYQVPIVFGAPKRDFKRLAPPLSFIHVEDFKTMKELADYILLVDSNDQLYNSYHLWRSHGNITRARLPDDFVVSCKSQCRIATTRPDVTKLSGHEYFDPFDSSWYRGCRNCRNIASTFLRD